MWVRKIWSRATKRKKIAPKKSRQQQEIHQLVKKRTTLKKLWRKPSLEEKENINLLRVDIKECLAKLRRSENLRIHRKKKEKARIQFYSDPFLIHEKLTDRREV